MPTQTEKGHAFRALHRGPNAFIIPNPWDAGSARLLAHLGFEALATTSAGHAFSLGQPDATVSRDKVMAHLSDMVSATDLPVSADLVNGFGDHPETVAETIRVASAAGVVGGSIEDSTGRPDSPLYERELAADRVRAAAEAARALSLPFVLTARAENFLVGQPDLGETIRRLQSYQEAGAEVLFAPGLTSRDDIAAVVSSVDRPVNVLMGLRGAALGLTDLSAVGVRRVSVGSALCRAAFGTLLRAGHEMREQGTFAFADEAEGYPDLNALFLPPPTRP